MDEGAWAALQDDFFRRIYFYVKRYVGNHQTAEDLTQDVFLGAVRGIAGFDTSYTLDQFLFGIARNVLLEHFRSARRQGELFDIMKTTAADVSPQPTPVTMMAKQRELRLLMQALRQIPIEHQITLELYYWEHMQAREIAAVFAVPEGTIRTRLRRARQLLVREIEALAESSTDLRSTVSGLEGWAAQLRDELARDGALR